ncbi:MAG TPA: hypothetical protein VFF65_04845 [Phycisphaerales bacterium]|nr:hypothetical protein [Phycisphaerales bacterium]
MGQFALAITGAVTYAYMLGASCYHLHRAHPPGYQRLCRCGYPVTGSPADARCPECARSGAARLGDAASHRRRVFRWSMLTCAACALPVWMVSDACFGAQVTPGMPPSFAPPFLRWAAFAVGWPAIAVVTCLVLTIVHAQLARSRAGMRG